MNVSSLDLRMTSAGKHFTWFEEKYPSLPIVRNPDGTISQVLTFYFGYLARTKKEGASSLEKRAYTLREWMAFLLSHGMTWTHGACDRIMHRWRQAQKESGVDISDNQIEVKLQRVYEFYLHIPDAMKFDENGVRVPEFVGSARDGFPITIKSFPLRGDEDYSTWSGQDRTRPAPAHPSILDDIQVESVGNAARSATDILKGDRDWLLTSCMSRGGLRGAEVADITCSTITDSLRRENILAAVEARFGPMRSIADIADNAEAQEVVLTSLKVFEQRRRRDYIFVIITGKGNKQRHAAFPVDLVRDILTIGIWTVRRHQLATRPPTGDAGVPKEVFLSFKTCDGMLPGSVSDIVKVAFIEAGIEGSGHELRKYYATNTANRILRRALDDFGYLTQAVLNTVYDQVASALGHSTVNTTTRHYVNVAMVHFTGLQAKRQRRRLLYVWETLLAQQDNLDAERIRLCGTAIRSIASVPKNSDLFAILEGALTDPDINPEGMLKFTVPKSPHLRLAVSNPVSNP